MENCGSYPGTASASIDPHHIPFNKLPPPVHIEQIVADGKTYDLSSQGSGGMHLPPRVRDLAIDYTALSLVVPEKVRFRFKLEGQDADWREVVNQRRVEYSNLPPRHYRFRVMACNNSGVWNEEGAALDFAVDPAYWQTNWFRALCAAAFLGMLWGLYQLRVRQLAYQFDMTLEARVGERTRIARELHDTLLQSFQGLMLRFQTVDEMLPARPMEAKEALEGALERADQAIIEGRDAISDIRAVHGRRPRPGEIDDCADDRPERRACGRRWRGGNISGAGRRHTAKCVSDSAGRYLSHRAGVVAQCLPARGGPEYRDGNHVWRLAAAFALPRRWQGH